MNNLPPDVQAKLLELENLKKKEALKKGLPHLYGMPWYKWAWDFFNSTNRYNFLCAANQISKDLAMDTEIPTPSGFVRMGDLKIGDQVFAQDGTPTEVIGIPYEGKGPGYRLTFADGSSVVAGPNHLWVCKTSRERFRKSYTSNWVRGTKDTWENEHLGQWKVLSTLQLIEAGGYSPEARSNWRKVSTPVCDPTKQEDKQLFDPYLLGLLLGDGCFRGKTVTISSADSEIVQYLELNGAKRTSTTITYRMPLGVRFDIERLGLHDALSEDKFIPEEYFKSSIDQRIDLLQGLMDTVGTASKTQSKHVSFTTVSPKLAKDVRTLVCSLGGTVKTKLRKSGYKKNGEHIVCQDSYQLAIKIKLNPFRLARKASLHCSEVRYKHERIIEKIEPIKKIESRCITVAHPTGTFLATRDFIVTHNSSTQIRKCIDWATDVKKWPKLWPGRTPRQFWYLYPSKTVSTAEVECKWVPEFLPAGEYKNHPQYGWHLEKKNKEVHALRFNSGVTVFFKTYAQDVQDLQTGSVDALWNDEELVVDLFDELNMRIQATDGYFHMVFTATLGQDMWRETIEEKGKYERFKDAFKQQISMYDCLQYMDGSPSPWTIEKINRVKNSCKSEAEVLKRVYGRFIVDSGLKYPSFERTKNVKPSSPLPQGWLVYAGIDIGGGGDGHPAAITFIGVSPDYRKARVFMGWRGEGETTTAADVLQKYIEMKGSMQVIEARFDWASKDFGTIAQRAGITVLPAEKSHERGEQILNVLFKNQILSIDDKEELFGLVTELMTLQVDTLKRKAVDDFIDSTRYCAATIPWDWSVIQGEQEVITQERPDPTVRVLKTNSFNDSGSVNFGIEEELAEWGALYD